jgi:hypothetical protein
MLLFGLFIPIHSIGRTEEKWLPVANRKKGDMDVVNQTTKAEGSIPEQCLVSGPMATAMTCPWYRFYCSTKKVAAK